MTRRRSRRMARNATLPSRGTSHTPAARRWAQWSGLARCRQPKGSLLERQPTHAVGQKRASVVGGYGAPHLHPARLAPWVSPPVAGMPGRPDAESRPSYPADTSQISFKPNMCLPSRDARGAMTSDRVAPWPTPCRSFPATLPVRRGSDPGQIQGRAGRRAGHRSPVATCR